MTENTMLCTGLLEYGPLNVDEISNVGKWIHDNLNFSGGKITSNKHLTSSLSSKEKKAQIIHENEIQLYEIPKKPIIKMAKHEHVEDFFRDGVIQLGAYETFRNHDNNEIGDQSEGAFVLVGVGSQKTIFTGVTGGFNSYIFSTFSGDPDKRCVERFGYDAGYEIINIQGFSNAIKNKINAEKYAYASCVYSQNKIIVGRIFEDHESKKISNQLLNIGGQEKYFVKPSGFSHQSEFRIIWKMSQDINKSKIFKCPEAIKYCRKIEV